MKVVIALVHLLKWFNDMAGRIGTVLSVWAIGMMVVVILTQVFCRYVLNAALPWPDEAARFLMLWLTGLMAPIALRQGGMVAIRGVLEKFPFLLFKLMSLMLMAIALLVLIVALQLGMNHVSSGWLFASSSLKLPLSLIGMKSIKIKLAWMYMSLLVGVGLMIVVKIELILRLLLDLIGISDRLPPITEQSTNNDDGARC